MRLSFEVSVETYNQKYRGYTIFGVGNDEPNPANLDYYLYQDKGLQVKTVKHYETKTIYKFWVDTDKYQMGDQIEDEYISVALSAKREKVIDIILTINEDIH